MRGRNFPGLLVGHHKLSREIISTKPIKWTIKFTTKKFFECNSDKSLF